VVIGKAVFWFVVATGGHACGLIAYLH